MGHQISKSLRRWLPFACLAFALLGLSLLLVGVSAQANATVEGVVVDASGPVSGARVRVRATGNSTVTASSGRFMLTSLVEGQKIEVTAWSDGYYIASTYLTPTVSGISLTLRPYHTTDHPEYSWTSPISGTSDAACGNCHPMIVSQWLTNAHGAAISNPRFYSLYNGTGLSGTASVPPGYLLDFPGTSGTCATCHAPGLGLDGFQSTDMNDARGVITAGIHCDYCHKIGGVYLNSATGSVYANAPGASSQRVLRPPPGDEIFFGPYDDIHDPDTYLPLISQSQWCAPCHQFSMWGTPIYESYEEWLASPYAAAGITCQECHMPPNGDTTFALPDKGGLEHPPETIPSHLQLGATSEQLLQETVTMTLDARQAMDSLQVTVTITNTGAGHHVPTDYPGRHLILVVSAVDDQGQALAQYTGPTVPEWGGDQAGQPGTIFAKVLRDVRTGEAPVVSYWRQALIASDNRLPALGSNRSTYSFATPDAGGPLAISAELRFRRAPWSILEAKGWDRPDIVMEESSITFVVKPYWRQFLPLAGR